MDNLPQSSQDAGPLTHITDNKRMIGPVLLSTHGKDLRAYLSAGMRIPDSESGIDELFPATPAREGSGKESYQLLRGILLSVRQHCSDFHGKVMSRMMSEIRDILQYQDADSALIKSVRMTLDMIYDPRASKQKIRAASSTMETQSLPYKITAVEHITIWRDFRGDLQRLKEKINKANLELEPLIRETLGEQYEPCGFTELNIWTENQDVVTKAVEAARMMQEAFQIMVGCTGELKDLFIVLTEQSESESKIMDMLENGSRNWKKICSIAKVFQEGWME